MPTRATKIIAAVWFPFIFAIIIIPCESFYLFPPTSHDDAVHEWNSRLGTRNLHALLRQQQHPESVVMIAGVECRPVLVSALNLTVLEATAGAQELLVEAALAVEPPVSPSSLLSQHQPPEKEQQHLASGDPYGMVVWPAAAALAQYLILRDLSKVRLWEVGSGTGVVSIAAAQQGALSVYATDYETLTLQLLEYAAYTMNGISSRQLVTGLWDIIRDTSTEDSSTSSPRPLPKADLLVAADVLYEPRTGVALADLALRALQEGMEVLVADSPGRAGRPAFLDRLNQSLQAPVSFISIPGTTITEKRHDLICGEGSTTISETPKPLPIALLELYPSMLRDYVTDAAV